MELNIFFYIDAVNITHRMKAKKEESFRKLCFFMADRYWYYFLYNTETSLTIVEKALAVLLEEEKKKTASISSTEDPANTELLSVKSSDTTTDLIF